MEPQNYIIPNPYPSIMEQLNAGLNRDIQLNNFQAQKQQAAIAQAEHKQMQDDLYSLSQKEGATANDYRQIITRYPQLAEHYKPLIEQMTSEQKAQRIREASEISAAIQAGQPQIAASRANEYADQYEASGMVKEAETMRHMAQLIGVAPWAARSSANMFLSQAMGPEQFEKTFSTLAKTPSDIAATESGISKTNAEIRNIDSQIKERTARLGLDAEKVQQDYDLKIAELEQKSQQPWDAPARKLIDDAVISSVSSDKQAADMTALAQEFDAMGGGYGRFSSGAEMWKNTFGSQDKITALRKQYVRFRNMSVIQSLPPGVASDRDIDIAMEGFPKENADSRHVASFLRVMAAASQYQAAIDSAKAEWVSAVGYLGAPRKDMTIEGINVPAGMTFPKFAKAYGSKLVLRGSRQTAEQSLQSKPYMKYGNQ